jgi:hypothetical protein
MTDDTDDVPELDAAEREANVRSILAIPDDQLPDREARAELVRRCLAGHDVYAYQPVARPWTLWVRQEGRPDLESRFAPAKWARLWREGKQ